MDKVEGIVRSMIGGAFVPDSLWARLDQIDSLCIAAGGRLRSRQVIATVVEQWERDNGLASEDRV